MGNHPMDVPSLNHRSHNTLGSILSPLNLNLRGYKAPVDPAPGTPVPASPKSGNGIFDVTKYGADPGCSKDSTKSVRFIGNNNGKLQNINFQNSKSFHLVINNCVGVDISTVHVTAPEDSPNTDGIHISGSSHIHVTNCQIGVGDDCVSIGDGTTDISIEGVTCGPGHGISVGSLGKYARETGVTGVHIKNCVLTGTTNGVRIKTWNGSPTLKASNITFEDITMDKVSFPIIIDQNYCPGQNCGSKPSAVQISDIIYQNIKGTSFTKLAVNLICSSGAPCQGVQLNNIDLTYQDAGQKVASMCQNVKPTVTGVQNPPACA
ncbi:exopolygalacturonase-like [Tasmannia lanceolata]|uniref:exopolygalacturonase-like n=1 Tax=Tasmannia lanceolata TaxID=3420 RepID=UPI004064B798